jgi:hypothetical protein
MAAVIRVLILQQGSPVIVDQWSEEDSSSLNLQKWEQSSSLWPDRLLKDEPEPMEVFLCLDKEFLSDEYDPLFLRRVIRQAHRSMWAANVYVVIDKDWIFESPDPEQPDPFVWTETVLENKVSDILQWSMKGDSNYSEAARRSRKRMEEVVSQAPRRKWKCLFQIPLTLSREEEFLLSPYVISSLSELDNENCLIVLQEQRDDYMQYVERRAEQASGFDMMVGVIDRIERLPNDLKSFCRSKGYGPVRFHGPLELYYFLQMLNGRRLHETDESHATPVRVVNPTFKSHLPQLLITHSYLPGETHNCLAAASDTWELVEEVHDKARVKIYPAVKCIKLAKIVEELGHVLAWIHIGHGDDVRGLQQSDDAHFKSPDDWVNSFAAYKSNLALALFSSRRSASVARRFAESGASVTVGFRQDVHKDICVELTKRVVKAALNSNGSQEEILKAFSDARRILSADDPNAFPVAFWASH